MDFDYNEQVRADARTSFAKAKERDDYIEVSLSSKSQQYQILPRDLA